MPRSLSAGLKGREQFPRDAIHLGLHPRNLLSAVFEDVADDRVEAPRGSLPFRPVKPVGEGRGSPQSPVGLEEQGSCRFVSQRRRRSLRLPVANVGNEVVPKRFNVRPLCAASNEAHSQPAQLLAVGAHAGEVVIELAAPPADQIVGTPFAGERAEPGGRPRGRSDDGGAKGGGPGQERKGLRPVLVGSVVNPRPEIDEVPLKECGELSAREENRLADRPEANQRGGDRDTGPAPSSFEAAGKVVRESRSTRGEEFQDQLGDPGTSRGIGRPEGDLRQRGQAISLVCTRMTADLRGIEFPLANPPGRRRLRQGRRGLGRRLGSWRQRDRR